MITKHISKSELFKIFFADNLYTLFAQYLPEAIEEVIPQMPIKHQKTARENLQKMKDDPLYTFAQLSELKSKTDFGEAIDCEGESYNYFVKICNEMTRFFDVNEEIIMKTYKCEYAKKGINLIVIE